MSHNENSHCNVYTGEIAAADVNVNKAFGDGFSQLKSLKESLLEGFSSTIKKRFVPIGYKNQAKEQSYNRKKLRHWVVVCTCCLFVQYWWNWIWRFIWLWTKSSTNITVQWNGWTKIYKNKVGVTEKVESRNIVKTYQLQYCCNWWTLEWFMVLCIGQKEEQLLTWLMELRISL